jgi:LPXTG-motif cell wall-anchored protein
VANEVSDETWRAFRTAVKSEGDNAIIGEIWTDASSYILGDMYDSVMNYRFRGAMLGFVQSAKVDDNNATPAAYTAVDAANELEKMREQYPREALEAMMNLVDSHDTQRVISSIDGYGKGGTERGFAADPTASALEKMRLISLLQMTYTGAPTIYYGDEMGLPGCDDPDNRRGTLWGKGNQGLVEWYAQMAAIRSAYANLRTGDVAMSTVEAKYVNDVMAYVRSDSADKALVAANRLDTDITVTLSAPGIADGTELTNIIDTGKSETYKVADGKVTVTIPAYRGVILVDNVKVITVNKDGLKDAYDPSYIVKDRTLPVNDSEVIGSIDTAETGTEVTVSTLNEGISSDVLNAIVNAKKNLIPVIKRGNFEMRVKDPSGLLAALNALGQNDVQIIFNENVIKNTAALDKINKDSIKYKFSLDTNLTDGILGTDMELTIPVGTDSNGKTLYLYYIDKDGKFQLVDEGVVKDGKLICTTNHFSDYVVLNEKIAVDTTGGTTTTTTATTTTTTTKTGDSTNILALIAMLFVASGSIVALSRKRRIEE